MVSFLNNYNTLQVTFIMVIIPIILLLYYFEIFNLNIFNRCNKYNLINKLLIK